MKQLTLEYIKKVIESFVTYLTFIINIIHRGKQNGIFNIVTLFMESILDNAIRKNIYMFKSIFK